MLHADFDRKKTSPLNYILEHLKKQINQKYKLSLFTHDVPKLYAVFPWNMKRGILVTVYNEWGFIYIFKIFLKF